MLNLGESVGEEHLWRRCADPPDAGPGGWSAHGGIEFLPNAAPQTPQRDSFFFMKSQHVPGGLQGFWLGARGDVDYTWDVRGKKSKRMSTMRETLDGVVFSFDSDSGLFHVVASSKKGAPNSWTSVFSTPHPYEAMRGLACSAAGRE
jgi:hypothetical protein